MIRLDKYLSSQGIGSRKEVHNLIKSGCVQVNGETFRKPDVRISEENDRVFVYEKEVAFRKKIYIVMNKPSGVVCATEDKCEKTVMDLLPKNFCRKGLFPAGRLDKDTTGLLIITDDGEFAHNMLSPKKHVDKRYFAELSQEVTEQNVKNFYKGIVFADGTLCKPAQLIPLEGKAAEVIISEGKFHQVKKMFLTQGIEVLKLKRLQIGGLVLPPNLSEGECRLMSEQEIVGVFS